MMRGETGLKKVPAFGGREGGGWGFMGEGDFGSFCQYNARIFSWEEKKGFKNQPSNLIDGVVEVQKKKKGRAI